jgi:hypothetical protein
MEKSNITIERASEKTADILIDGCKVKLRFVSDAPDKALRNIRSLLLNSLTHASAHEKKS